MDNIPNNPSVCQLVGQQRILYLLGILENMSRPHHVDGDGLRDAGLDEDRGGLEWPHWVVDQAVVAPLLGRIAGVVGIRIAEHGQVV